MCVHAAPVGKEADEGSISSVRDVWFRMVHGLLDSSVASGGPLRGSLFWQASWRRHQRGSLGRSLSWGVAPALPVGDL